MREIYLKQASITYICNPFIPPSGMTGKVKKYWRLVRVVEGARLESVYTSKGYRGFESLSLRKMEKEKFFVYILQSMKDFSFYIGQTNDLDFRVCKHNEGMSRYTSSKRPWRLVYFEMYNSRSEAIFREKQLKGWKNPHRYRTLILNWKTGPDISGI